MRSSPFFSHKEKLAKRVLGILLIGSDTHSLLQCPLRTGSSFAFFPSGGGIYLGDFVQEREVHKSIFSLSQLIKRRAKVAVIVEGKDQGVFVANGAGFCKK